MKKSDERTPSGAAVSELIVAVFRLNGRLLVAGDRLVASLGLTSARWQVPGAIALSPAPEPVARLAPNIVLNRHGVQRLVGEPVAEDVGALQDKHPRHSPEALV